MQRQADRSGSGKTMNNIFLSTAAQQVWDFLCRNSQETFYSAQVASRTGLSQGGTNQALREMARQGLVKVERKGRMLFYRVDARSPLIRQFKVLRNLALVEELIRKIKPLSERIVLFGSCARGEDTPDSDLDIFVVAGDKDQVRRLMKENKDRRKVQLLTKTPQEFIALETKDPVFYQEVQKGMVLWEKES